MASSFAWLDYSDEDQRRVLDVVRSLSEKDTRDELGFASVRDALADRLAPGISTIQTRIRYFLFIPWIHQELERRMRNTTARVTKTWIADRARNAEVDLIPQLAASADAGGTIGRDAGAGVQRLPSSVYWNGLAAWGIRLCPFSLDTYYHRLATYGPPAARDDAAPAGSQPNWHPGLPPIPDGFPNGASMQLERNEADYLASRILETHADSLLGQLVLAEQAIDQLTHPWEVLDQDIDLPPSVVEPLRHGREFSLAMHGAVILYNLMLAEALPVSREDWTESYRTLFADWADEIREHEETLKGWDRAVFWDTIKDTRPRVPLGSRRFIDAWLDRLVQADDPGALVDCSYCRNMIDQRERSLKREQARLHNPRLLELWNGDRGVGLTRLSYRWPVLRSHVTDIQRAAQPRRQVAHA